MTSLPAYGTREAIADRLRGVFPQRNAKPKFLRSRVGGQHSVCRVVHRGNEGSGRYLAPKHVYRMTSKQTTRDDSSPIWSGEAVQGRGEIAGTRWYADNTREPIRDETLREGLVAVGAVIARSDLPTT